MDHLTIDDIIGFVSSDRPDEESLLLIATVNQHIRKCPGCFRKVRAFQVVYDEFVEMSVRGNFKDYFNNRLKNEKNEKDPESEEMEYDGLR